MSAEQILHEYFSSGRPIVLFLGQAIDPAASQEHSVLHRLLRRIGRGHGGWHDVLSHGLSDSDLEWLTERFERTVQSEAMQAALALPWSALFTTSIDPSILRHLETRGRQPEAITSGQYYPRVPRSTARPPVHFLFGRTSDITDQGARPPRNSNELTRRLVRHSSVLLSRLPDTVTPAGLLVIDGYSATDDWLPLDSLLSALPEDGSVAILWLAPDEKVFDAPLFAELSASGSVSFEKRRLAELVADMETTGGLAAELIPVLHEPGVISLGDDEFVEISPSLRLRVEASAAIVDNDWSSNPSLLSFDAERDLFRRLHGYPGSNQALVEGVARGFYIKRKFEDELYQRVISALARPTSRERVVVLHGQSGTGKSIALARIAYLARTELKVPVLFAADRFPEATDIAAFCEEMDRQDHGPTLVLCDSNTTPDRYFQLSGALGDKGRKHVIVGTSYRLDAEKRESQIDRIEAPNEISPSEREELHQLVRKFSATDFEDPESLDGEHVLALLYRLIPAGRSHLASGLSSEAHYTEDSLWSRANQPTSASVQTEIGQQLVALGFSPGEKALFGQLAPVAFDQDVPKQLIEYVMVAGRLNIAIPINLLIRTLRAQITTVEYQDIARLFKGLDLFRWRYGDEEKTELLVGPRLSLEAELICLRWIANPDRELESLIGLIEAVRPRGVDQDSEKHFLFELLQKLDRDGPRSNAYSAGYLRIARALTALRAEHGIDDANLMLQESQFRRAWIMENQNRDIPVDVRDGVLDEAREAVEEAISKSESRELYAGKRTRQNLYVERASIYGFLSGGQARNHEEPEIIWAAYSAAMAAARIAMNFSPSYYPNDVALWISRDVYKEAAHLLSDSQRAEIVANIHSDLDRVDPQELSPEQFERFKSNQNKIGIHLLDSTLEEDAIRDLEKQSPAAAVFLRARKLVSSMLDSDSNDLAADVRQSALSAQELLESQLSTIANDIRCLRLLIECQWAAETGQRWLRGIRRRTPFDKQSLNSVLRTIRRIEGCSVSAVDPKVRYLEAVLLWLLGDGRAARETWRSLSQDTDFVSGRRGLRRLLMSGADGQAIVYRGRLMEERAEGKWRVRVEGLADPVDLVVRDFRAQTLRKGGEVRDFHIAFNYLGPIADPVSYGDREP